MSDSDSLLRLSLILTDLVLIISLGSRRDNDAIKEIFERVVVPAGAIGMVVLLFWNMFPEIMFGGSWGDFGKVASSNSAPGGLMAGAAQMAAQMRATGDYSQLYIMTGLLGISLTIVCVMMKMLYDSGKK